MAARLVVSIVFAAFAAAGCGGEEPETLTVTETVTETVAPEGADHPAFQLAEDVCSALPRGIVAPFLGVDADNSGRLADEFAELARPELRDPARAGCLEALERSG